MKLGDTVMVIESQSAMYQRTLKVGRERLRGTVVRRDPNNPRNIAVVVKVDGSFEFAAFVADLEVV